VYEETLFAMTIYVYFLMCVHIWAAMVGRNGRREHGRREIYEMRERGRLGLPWLVIQENEGRRGLRACGGAMRE
jgi:hypothetical protein